MTKMLATLSICLASLAAAASPLLAGELPKEQLPATAKWVIHVNVEQFVASKLGKAFLAEADKKGLGVMMNAIKGGFGIDPLKDITDATLYGTGFEKDKGVMMIRGKLDRATLVDAIKKTNETFQETKADDRSFYTWKDKDGTKVACFYSDQLVVVAPDAGMVKAELAVLDGKADNLTKNADMAKMIPASAGAFATVVAAQLPAATAEKPQPAFVSQIAGGTLQIGEADDKFYAHLAVTAKDDRVAGDLRKVAEGAQALVDLVGPAREAAAAGTPREGIPAELHKIAMAITVTQQGKTVKADLSIPVQEAIDLLKSIGAEKPVAKPTPSRVEPPPAK